MRRVTLAAALFLFAAPAFAQTATPSTTPNAAPAAAEAPASTAPADAKAGKHLSMKKRFEAANTTHDGHLTKDQAEAAGNMKRVVKNFDAIDSSHKGYVTMEEIHAYNKAHHTAHKAKKAAE